MNKGNDCKAFLNRLKNGELLFGQGLMYPASGIIEAMCNGWDLIWIDCQHGQIDYKAALEAVRVADSVGIASVVRVHSHDSGILAKFADIRPTALMVPMVDDAEMAANIVRALRFHPVGQRSFGGRRVIDLCSREYYKLQEPVIIPQIETTRSVENIEEIAAVQGVDVLFFGPDDMRVQCQLPINTPIIKNAELRSAAEKVSRAAKQAGKFCGIVAVDEETVKFSHQQGYQVIVSGCDVGYLRTMAAEQLSKVRAWTAGLIGTR